MRARWTAYVAPGLLAVVACVQIALAFSVRQSPWLCGGFGMFSTADVWHRRHLHAFALRPGLRRQLVIPESVAELADDVLQFPSDRRLRELGRELARADGLEPSVDAAPLEAVEIQVFGARFAPHTLEPRGVLLRSMRVAVDGPP